MGFLKGLWTLFLSLLTLSILGVLAVVGVFWYFGQDLPDYHQLAQYDPPVVTRIHAGDGRLFAEYAHEKRLFIPIQSMPKQVVDTFLAVEDKNFFDHPGLDWTGILRATLANGLRALGLKKGGTMGGSTITQQVAKNFLLTSQKTLVRKIKEAILSLRIERTFSKEKILELYLNEIYLGSGTYGVGAAALEYFNKSLRELNPEECAYIAGLPKAPSRYNPKRNYKGALKRRNWVITRMFEEGIISQEEAIKAIESPLTLNKRKTLTIDTNYFTEHIRQEIVKRYGRKAFYEGGLSVRTTLDSRLQALADQALRHGLVAYDRRFGWRGPIATLEVEGWQQALQALKDPEGLSPWQLAIVLAVEDTHVEIGLKNGQRGTIALSEMTWAKKHGLNPKTGYPQTGPEIQHPSEVLAEGHVVAVSLKGAGQYALEQIPQVNGGLIAMDPHTGRVLALDGGFRFGKSQFNRVTQAYRQVGSTIKPLAYMAAFERGYRPNTMVLDAPMVVDMGGTLWKPQNITKRFYGLVTLREALEQSYNLALVRVTQDIGMEAVAEMAKRLGAYDTFSLDLANALGSEETTLLKMATAYASFVNGGKKITPVMIDRIQDRHGKNIYRASTKAYTEGGIVEWKGQLPPTLEDTREQVIDPVHAYQMVSILEGAVKNSASRRAGVAGHHVAGKTGTSSNYFDAWFVGFSPDLLVAVTVGFDRPRSMGRYQTGSRVAAPIFKEFMTGALKDQPAVPFRIPEGVKFVRVNKKTGKPSAVKTKSTLLEVLSKRKTSHEKFSGLMPDETDGIY